MEACEDYQVIGKFDKVFSQYIERILAWLLPNFKDWRYCTFVPTPILIMHEETRLKALL